MGNRHAFLRHSPRCSQTSSTPRQCHDGFVKTVVFIVNSRPRNCRGKAISNAPTIFPTTTFTMYPRRFYATIVPRRFPKIVVLLEENVYETVVARQPATPHDSPTKVSRLFQDASWKYSISLCSLRYTQPFNWLYSTQASHFAAKKLSKKVGTALCCLF